MRNKKPRYHRLSRKQKIVICLVLIVIALYGLISTNAPVTPMAAFRLAEKAALLDPGQILGTESATPNGQDSIIVAQNDTACITFAYEDFKSYSSDDLAFRKKNSDLTFVSIKSYLNYGLTDKSLIVNPDHTRYLPIVLFDDYPDAARAELDITLCRTDEEPQHKKLYQVTAERQSKGYFLFYLEWHSDFISEDREIDSLQRALADNIVVNGFEAPTVIRLYDKNDQLILEREMDIARE